MHAGGGVCMRCPCYVLVHCNSLSGTFLLLFYQSFIPLHRVVVSGGYSKIIWMLDLPLLVFLVGCRSSGT